MTTDWQYSKKNIIQTLNEKGIRLSKTRGQNFLIDKNVLSKTIRNVDVNDNDCIIEIGPGIGGLTKFIEKLNKKIYAVELDKKLFEIMKNEYKDNRNLTVINANFLDVEIKNFIEPNKKAVIISNIPYNITSRIIEKCFLNSEIITDLYLLMQKELAERIVSKENSKNYGSLSIFTQVFSITTMLFEVTKNVFFPKPKVNSAFVHFKIKSNVEATELLEFSKFIKKIFSYRRKNILGILNKYFFKNMDKDIIKTALLDRFEISPLVRPENISPEIFYNLWKYIKHKFNPV